MKSHIHGLIDFLPSENYEPSPIGGGILKNIIIKGGKLK